MAYEGSNDDRERAREIYAWYVDSVKKIVCWLIETDARFGYSLATPTGPTRQQRVRYSPISGALRPELDDSWVVAEKVSTFSEIMEAMEPLGAVIATRFHNLIAAMMLPSRR